MVNEVNKLIYNTLVEQGALFIPNVGTLSIRRTAASKRRSGVVAPSYSVAYSAECQAISLTAVIVAATNISQDAAADVVDRWYKKVNVDGTIAIDGVGTLQNDNFEPDHELVALLNAHAETIYVSGKKSVKRWKLWLGLLISLIAVGVVGYMLVHKYGNLWPLNDNTYSTTELVADDLVVDNKADSVLANEAVILSDSTASALVEPMAQELATDDKSQSPVVNEESSEEITATVDWRNAEVRHYVIYGSYSTIANANKAVSKILRRNPEAKCKIISLGSMHAVDVYGSTNRGDCEKFLRQHRSMYKDSWIHTPKKYR